MSPDTVVMPSCGGFGAGLTARGAGLTAGLGGAGFGAVCAGLACDAAASGAGIAAVIVVATIVATATTPSAFMVITEQYHLVSRQQSEGGRKRRV